MRPALILTLTLFILPLVVAAPVNECATPASAWIWCDDFEQDRLASYFEYADNNGRFTRTTGVGLGDSTAMRAVFDQGTVSAGNLKLAFGRTPQAYMAPVDDGTADYQDIYWRMYVRHQDGWQGGGADKLSRATIFADGSWSQALFAHVWSMGSNHHYLGIDPASGTDTQGNLLTSGYNDFSNMRWLGARASDTPIFDSSHVGEWYCIEARARLNDAGQSNGVFQLWIDDVLEAERTGMNWVGSYDDYGINSVMFENYWNSGSVTQQERYFDNIIVSTERIGCGTQDNPGDALIGDVNEDGIVDVNDLLLILSDFRRATFDARADVNGDGVVNVFDLVLVAREFGRGTLPSTSPDNPTPPPTYNEPEGLTMLSNHSLNAIAANGWNGQSNGGTFSIITDPTAPHTPSSIGRMTYPVGFPGGYSAGTTWSNTIDEHKEIYLRFWVRYSENWQAHPSGVNKIFFITDESVGGGGDPMYLHLYTNAENPYFQVRKQGPTGAVNYPENIQHVSAPVGEWYLVETHLVMNSASGVADGEAHLWVNGVKTSEHTNILWSNGDQVWDGVKWDPTWGGVSSQVQEEMHMDIDHIYMSGTSHEPITQSFNEPEGLVVFHHMDGTFRPIDQGFYGDEGIENYVKVVSDGSVSADDYTVGGVATAVPSNPTGTGSSLRIRHPSSGYDIGRMIATTSDVGWPSETAISKGVTFSKYYVREIVYFNSNGYQGLKRWFFPEGNGANIYNPWESENTWGSDDFRVVAQAVTPQEVFNLENAYADKYDKWTVTEWYFEPGAGVDGSTLFRAWIDGVKVADSVEGLGRFYVDGAQIGDGTPYPAFSDSDFFEGLIYYYTSDQSGSQYDHLLGEVYVSVEIN